MKVWETGRLLLYYNKSCIYYYTRDILENKVEKWKREALMIFIILINIRVN